MFVHCLPANRVKECIVEHQMHHNVASMFSTWSIEADTYDEDVIDIINDMECPPWLICINGSIVADEAFPFKSLL